MVLMNHVDLRSTLTRKCFGHLMTSCGQCTWVVCMNITIELWLRKQNGK